MDRPVLQSGRHEAKTGDFRYKAFISYSWADAKWGKWLQQAIETYRTPKKLIGTDAKHGPVPARLNPLFKDREEEAAGASIGAAVEAALADSEFLIVICSPNSAKSQWVDRELAWFKTHRDPDKVLALIVDGEPGDAQRECFPKALTHIIAPDMAITDAAQDAPLAADARESGDGKRIAKLKIAAAMLGVGLDELVRRDERRRTIRTRIITTASLALAAVMSTLTWFAVEARKEAEFQRNEADGLVEFMLTDLREKLEPVGRLDALDVVGDRALDYYAAQKLGDLDADALGRRSRALLLVGEISNIRGDSEEALKAFTQAAATTKEQLARDPANEQRIFDHAQSVFWVGAIAYGRGEMVDAEAQFQEYKRLADRLIELDPNNPEWQTEGSYAETNLGAMYFEAARYEEAASSFLGALERIEEVAKLAEYDAATQIEVGNAANWAADANSHLGRIDESLALLQREIAIYEGVLERDPSNANAKNRLAIAKQFVAGELLDLGKLDQAMKSLDHSLLLLGELRSLEPDNAEWKESETRGRLALSEFSFYAGQTDLSSAQLKQATFLLDEMLASDPSNAIWAVELKVLAYMNDARLAMSNDKVLVAKSHLERASALFENDPDQDNIVAARVYRLLGDTQARLGQDEAAHQSWKRALGRLPKYAAADLHGFLILSRLGRKDQAEKTAKKLDRRGFHHPLYLAER